MNSSGSFSANGTRPQQNNYLLNGMDNNSNAISMTNGTAYVVQPPIDAIEEFKVQTSNYNAEFGRGGGAVLNASIKSGTNQLHGDVWEFLRNNKLDAADFFENANGLSKESFAGTSSGSRWVDRSTFRSCTTDEIRRFGSSTMREHKCGKEVHLSAPFRQWRNITADIPISPI